MNATTMVREHRSQLVQLRAMADRDLIALVAAVDGLPVADVRDLLIEALPGLVAPYATASGELAAVLYEDLRAEAGRRGAFYADVADAVPSQARVSGTARWAVVPLVDESLGSTLQSRLAGSVARVIMDASRDTMQVNGARESVRFQRMARPGACAYCGMLASRPPWQAYKSEGTAGAGSHDSCQCLTMPLYPGSEMASLAQVEREKWEEKYRQALTDDDGHVLSDTKDILAEWRKYHGTR